MVEGLPDTNPPVRSFSDVLSLPHAAARRFKIAEPDAALSFDDAVAGSHKGFPSVNFDDTHVANLSKSFPWTLIGKFSQGFNRTDPKKGRPPVEDLQKFFRTLNLKAEFSLGLLDNRHLLIRLSSEEDYLRLYSRTVWYVAKVTMRIFKWSPYFNVDRETSMAPVWISMPRLPIIFFVKPALFRIASLLGDPLRLDTATASMKRPGVARIQIEIDLLKERPTQIWIGMGSVSGFWQKIEYERVPPYCTHCRHVGHAEEFCTIFNPGLKSAGNVVQLGPKSRQEYRKIKDPASKTNLALDKGKGFSADAQGENNLHVVVHPVEHSANQPATFAEQQAKFSAAEDLELRTANLGEHVSADFRPTEKQTERPIAMQTANLGEHASAVGETEAATVGETERPIGESAPTRPTEDRSDHHTVTTQALFRTLRSDLLIHSPTASPSLVEQATNSMGELQENIMLDNAQNASLKQHVLESPRPIFPKPVVFCGDATLSDTNFQMLSSPPGRTLPPSFQPTYNFDALDDGYSSWRTVNSGEENAEDEDSGREDSMEEFLASQSVRDDEYLDQRRTRQVRRDRDLFMMRRGRGRPLGTRSRTFSDEDLPNSILSQSARSNKGIPPKHFEPGL